MSLAALRQRLSVLADPPPAGGEALPTGIVALDRILSDGGLPRGRLTEVVGTRGSGATTLIRRLVATALAAGRWVAYVDGTRTLAPRDWAAVGHRRRLWIVRPPNADRSVWCADILLRSGAFGLVVLDGGPLSRSGAVRLTRLARDHHAVLVVVGEDRRSGVVGSAVRLRVGRPGRRAVLRIAVEKGGRHQFVEVACAIDVARRLCAHPEIPDRRGVATRNRRGERADPAAPGMRPPTAPGATLPRKRRCAEPVVRRDEFLLGGGCRQ